LVFLLIMSVNSESIFELYFLGMVHNVNLGTNVSQKADVLLIDKVEEAQVSYRRRRSVIDVRQVFRSNRMERRLCLKHKK